MTMIVELQCKLLLINFLPIISVYSSRIDVYQIHTRAFHLIHHSEECVVKTILADTVHISSPQSHVDRRLTTSKGRSGHVVKTATTHQADNA